MNTLNKLEEDIQEFFKTSHQFFFNERDLQMNLAVWLMKEKSYPIEVEYRIASNTIKQYPWGEKIISTDLVVVSNGRYILIELKYKTCSLKNDETEKFYRFGEVAKLKDVVKNQSAQDLGRYGFWKDVKRIELIKQSYKKVLGGIAIFVTNDKSYTTAPKEQEKKVGYYDFRMLDNNEISGILQWRKDGKIREVNIPEAYPNFKLSGTYTLHWEKYTTKVHNGDEVEMHYVICKIQ